jgi:hypothetical protein
MCRSQLSQEADGLGDETVGGGGAHTEPGPELGVGVAVAEMGEGEQSLPTRAQAPPSGADSLPTFSQVGGEGA